jgi:ubiquinone/menaquinone biosynthesis C-methylase UbiE
MTQTDNLYTADNSVDWEKYQKYRPNYPLELYDALFAFHAKGSASWGKAVDFGSGDGMVLPHLLKKFHQVEATDASSAQLELGCRRLWNAGVDNDRLTLQVCAAGHWKGPDSSVDMITSAMSIHWFDRPQFFKDAARMLKPGGTLAIWIASLRPCITNNPQAAEILREWQYKYFYPELAANPAISSNHDDIFHLFDSLLDALAIENSSAFEAETRYKLMLPKGFEYGLISGPADLSTPPNNVGEHANVVVETPEEPEDCLIRRFWTAKDFGHMYDTIGRAKEFGENISETAAWKECEAKMNAVMGGPEGTVEVCWAAALVLVRKKA